METNVSTSGTEPAPKEAPQPAPGADVQKPTPPAGEATAEVEAQETTEQTEAREKSRFQRRLDRQKSARVAAETETRMLREQLAKLEGQSKPQQAAEPKREDFQSDTEYLRAAAKHDAEQAVEARLKSEREAQQGKEKQDKAAAGNEKVAKAWAERESTFQTATKDYEAVVQPFADDELQSFSREARMAIVESEVGPALLYYLAQPKNAAEAERIADLSPARQIAELGKLELKVSMPGKKTTSAPPPANTTTGGKTATKDLSKMSQEEYEAHRKSQGARWAR